MLSIDITDRQIKLVRGVHSGNKIRVQDADMRELTLGMVSNGYITDVPMVAAELNDIIKTKGITEKDAIVSITSSSIVYKEMLLPKPKSLKNTARPSTKRRTSSSRSLRLPARSAWLTAM